MNGYMNVANSKYLFICSAVLVAFVIIQSMIFLRMALKRGKELNISKDKMKRAFKSGIITSVVPSVAIVVALISLVPVLGIPVPWGRLSVIGSLTYEVMAAGIGASVMGVDGLGGSGYTVEVFASSVWVMCFGSIWAVSMVALFLKTFKKKVAEKRNIDKKWNEIFSSAAFIGVFSVFITEPIVQGGISLITLVAGAILMVGMIAIMYATKVKWLRDFALPISMLGAMACSILFSI